MSTKTKTTKGRKNSAQSKAPKPHKYNRLTKDLARENGHITSRLLWYKILALATPEMREMLFAHTHLDCSVRRVVPEEFAFLDTRPVEHFDLLDEIHKAEELLTGMTREVHDEVFRPRLEKLLEKAAEK